MQVQDVVARRIIPVVVLDDVKSAEPLADALASGGLPVAEITFRTDAAVQAIRRIASRGDVIVGAGTVTSAVQVEQAADAGAAFVVSPGFSEEVLQACADRRLAAIPGVATATEIMGAVRCGFQTVKLFPASVVGGLDAVRALGAPFPSVAFIPTGGITAENAAAYLAEPQVAAVGGSWMVPRQLVAAQDFDRIRELVEGAARLGIAAKPEGVRR